MERRIMKGLLLPREDLHLSERLPRMGVRKNPTRGDRHQIRVMWDCDTPDSKVIKAIKFSAILTNLEQSWRHESSFCSVGELYAHHSG